MNKVTPTPIRIRIRYEGCAEPPGKGDRSSAVDPSHGGRRKRLQRGSDSAFRCKSGDQQHRQGHSQDHIQHCLVDAIESGDMEAVQELNKAIDSFIK